MNWQTNDEQRSIIIGSTGWTNIAIYELARTHSEKLFGWLDVSIRNPAPNCIRVGARYSVGVRY